MHSSINFLFSYGSWIRDFTCELLCNVTFLFGLDLLLPLVVRGFVAVASAKLSSPGTTFRIFFFGDVDFSL